MNLEPSLVVSMPMEVVGTSFTCKIIDQDLRGILAPYAHLVFKRAGEF